MKPQRKYLWWVLAVVVLLGVFMASQCQRLNTSTDQLTQTQSIITASTDSVRYYRDQLGRIVGEKRALEADMSALKISYSILSHNQKQLATDIQTMTKAEQAGLVAAASVVQTVTIHDHTNIDSSHVWSLASDTLRYHIRTLGDTLHVDSLTIPNRVIVSQYRDPKKVLHVTARNTNPMLKNSDVDAIVPPEKKPSGFVKWALVVVFIGGVMVAR